MDFTPRLVRLVGLGLLSVILTGSRVGSSSLSAAPLSAAPLSAAALSAAPQSTTDGSRKDTSGEEDAASPSGAKPKADGATPAPAKMLTPLGEKLVYRGVVTKAGVSVDAGTAVFTVTMNDDDRVQLTTCAMGEKFGYTLATRIVSNLNPERTAPVEYLYDQQGSESRIKDLTFTPTGAVYRRYKHCAEPGCEDPGHMIDGKHCPDRDCRIPAHMHWKVRREHEYETPHFDMLSAVYLARGLRLDPDKPGIEIPVINDHDRWIVRASAKRGGRLRVKAGIFDTVKVILDPVPAPNTNPNERFRGLFGLNGTIEIWLDRKSMRPVLVRGHVPFGFMDMNAKIELIEVGTSDKACELEVTKPRGREGVDDFGQ